MESPASSAVKESSSCFLLAIQQAGCSQLQEQQRPLFGEGSVSSKPSLPRAGRAKRGCGGSFPLGLAAVKPGWEVLQLVEEAL